MRYLHAQRIPVIPLARLVNYLHRGAPVPDHSVVITIDDGYKSALTKAWPILHEFNFPFTLFVYPQYIDSHLSALTWKDLKFLNAQGVDIQGHSLTHPLLTSRVISQGKGNTRLMAPAEYFGWLDHELRESKRQIEEHIGKKVTVLAYPFGGYDEQVVERTRLAGYEAALTCDDGNVDRFTDPFHINRRLVYRHVRLKEFAAYLPDRELVLTDLSPRDGEQVRRPLTEIRARVVNVQRVLRGSGRALVDKFGPKGFRVAIDPHTGIFHIPMPPHPKGGYYFISLFARDAAQPTVRREASWQFILHTKLINRNVSKN